MITSAFSVLQNKGTAITRHLVWVAAFLGANEDNNHCCMFAPMGCNLKSENSLPPMKNVYKFMHGSLALMYLPLALLTNKLP
jgi:hypothetical protein